MLKYLKKCLSKKYTLILVLIFILQNIKDGFHKDKSNRKPRDNSADANDHVLTEQ